MSDTDLYKEQITKAMHNLFRWRTVIIIAHRLQTVKKADRILVLETWEVSEEWTHKELVKQKWIYKKMLDLQSGFYYSIFVVKYCLVMESLTFSLMIKNLEILS